MAYRIQEAGFWLPSEFFDDFLTDKENNFKKNNTESDSEFCFPTEFPYPETESDKEDLFTLFTRQTQRHHFPPKHLEKGLLLSTSPQSTLTHNGSWSGGSAGGSSNGSSNGRSQVASPPTTPLGVRNEVASDLIYQAAGQVAKLKLNNSDGPIKQKGILGPPRSLPQLYPVGLKPNLSVLPNAQDCGMSYGQLDMFQNRRMSQGAWPIQRNSTRVVGSPPRAGLLGGAGGGVVVKRECAGTGVFLPRRYGNNNISNDCNAYSSDTRRKPVHSNALLPIRAVDNMNYFTHSQPQFQSQSLLNGGSIPGHDLLIARMNADLLLAQNNAYSFMAQRNASMLQHRQRLLSDGSALAMLSQNMYLPQEWTY